MTAYLRRIVAPLIFVALMPSVAGASTAKNNSDIATLRALIAVPEGQIDLARAKVAIDHMVDPTVDVPSTLRLLDEWAAKARARFPPGATNKVKLDLLLSTLYEPGPWNDHRPFSYDDNDPFGRDPRVTLISRYLSTRKGECVTMPTAFVLLGQKLGLPVTLTTVPYLVVVKYGDEEISEWTNVEATSGRIYYDSDYIRSLKLPSEAINSGIFLRPYAQKETVALFATATLAASYARKKDPERLLEITDLILATNPKDVVAMTLRGDAYYLLLERLKSKYGSIQNLPPLQRTQYAAYSRANLAWYAKAESLGWREWSKADWSDYQKLIEKKKNESTKRKGGK